MRSAPRKSEKQQFADGGSIMRVRPATYISCAAVGFIATSIFAWPTIGRESAAAVPDLSGLWAREFLGFDPPEFGPGPIANTSRLPNGQSSLRQLVGDYTNPILKPEAAEILKKRGEISLSGTSFPDPGNQCWPQPTPYIFWQREIQLVQQRDQVIILYMQDHQIRRVRMHVQHPAKITPTWHGDSVGHYEGDVLVVDTIGVKVGLYSMADRLGTPQSEAVHVVERYRLIDYEAAVAAEKASEKQLFHIPTSSPIGEGIAVDPVYRGKGLQLQFTVEDPNVFTMAWSATSTYRRALSPWTEYICSENPHKNFGGFTTNLPEANTPDF
jgi:hypothetical protein